MKRPLARRLRTLLGWLALNGMVAALLLVLLEGLSSYLLTARSLLEPGALAERRHTRYDPELGWVSEASVRIADMYGEGRPLATNARGFRGEDEIRASVSEGKIRIICSGDSFTFGYGVGDDATWCHRLMALDERLETVNMGQGGYGVDQAYLWYKRDAADLQHQVHILAFITEDFRRLRLSSYSGFGKPVLALENGALSIRNVPVPPPAHAGGWLAKQAQSFGRLRTLVFLRKALDKLGLLPSGDSPQSSLRFDEDTAAVLGAVLEDLHRLNEQRSSRLVLVYLPLESELRNGAPGEWNQFLGEQARKLGVPYFELGSGFRNQPYEKVARAFLRPGELPFPGSAGHYNELGNEIAADILYEMLRQEPALADLFTPVQEER